MLHIGMDISKKEIVLYVDTSEQHHTIPNTEEATEDFFRTQGFLLSDTLVGCEATGDFHRASCQTALRLGYPVKVLNPLLTKRIVNATVRKKKTDFSDAEIIAKLLADGYGESVNEATFQQSQRTILRTEQHLIHCTSDLKRLRHTLKLKGETMNVDEALKAVDRCIQLLEEEAKELSKKSLQEQTRQEEIIDSVPGCGEKLAAIISAEAGDIKRFPSANQFKAYVGIDPVVKQSGGSLHTGAMSKRGNVHLRYALFLVANISRQWDPDMKAFYEKKRSEGKSYRHAVCAVSRKLCERIYAIVSKDCLYQVNKPSC